MYYYMYHYMYFYSLHSTRHILNPTHYYLRITPPYILLHTTYTPQAHHLPPLFSFLSNSRNVKVGLGTDIAGGYSPSILVNGRQAVLHSMLLFAQVQHTGTPTPPNKASSDTTENGYSDNTGCELGGGQQGCVSDEKRAQLKPKVAIDFRDAMYLATVGGAKAMGLDAKIGTLH